MQNQAMDIEANPKVATISPPCTPVASSSAPSLDKYFSIVDSPQVEVANRPKINLTAFNHLTREVLCMIWYIATLRLTFLVLGPCYGQVKAVLRRYFRFHRGSWNNALHISIASILLQVPRPALEGEGLWLHGHGLSFHLIKTNFPQQRRVLRAERLRWQNETRSFFRIGVTITRTQAFPWSFANSWPLRVHMWFAPASRRGPQLLRCLLSQGVWNSEAHHETCITRIYATVLVCDRWLDSALCFRSRSVAASIQLFTHQSTVARWKCDRDQQLCATNWNVELFWVFAIGGKYEFLCIVNCMHNLAVCHGRDLASLYILWFKQFVHV